jgi:hypothetical protein
VYAQKHAQHQQTLQQKGSSLLAVSCYQPEKPAAQAFTSTQNLLPLLLLRCCSSNTTANLCHQSCSHSALTAADFCSSTPAASLLWMQFIRHSILQCSLSIQHHKLTQTPLTTTAYNCVLVRACGCVVRLLEWRECDAEGCWPQAKWCVHLGDAGQVLNQLLQGQHESQSSSSSSNIISKLITRKRAGCVCSSSNRLCGPALKL